MDRTQESPAPARMGFVPYSRNAGRGYAPHLTGSASLDLAHAFLEARRSRCDWVAFVQPNDVATTDWEADVGRISAGCSDAVAAIVTRPVVVTGDGAEVRRDRHGLGAMYQSAGEYVDTDVSLAFAFPDLTGIVFRVAALRELVGSPRSELQLLHQILQRYPRVRVAAGTEFVTEAVPELTEDALLPLLEDLRLPGNGKQRGSVAASSLYWLRKIYLRELAVATRTTLLNEAEKQRILEATARVVEQIDDESIKTFSVTRMRAELRLLFIALRGDTIPPIGHTTLRGPASKTELRYLHVGTKAHERFWCGVEEIPPSSAKWRKLDYFGQELLWERIVWLPVRHGLRAEVDGRELNLGRRSYPAVPALTRHSSRELLLELGPEPAAEDRQKSDKSAPTGLLTQLKATLTRFFSRDALRAASPDEYLFAKASSPYREAWLLMDRVTAGGDNAEVLFRYLSQRRRDINAWFVLDGASSDFARLKQQFGRVIAYGSDAHFDALKHAVIVASSFVDAEMTHPLPARVYERGVRPWRFVYLQHGVLHNDLSLWFNSKPIDLMITSNRDEHRTVVRDGSRYILSSEIVKLTGFPRHDELVQYRANQSFERDLIVLAPTWRIGLMGAKDDKGRRELGTDLFSSEFLRQWNGLANDPELVALSRAHDCGIVFLPHPNMRGLMPADTLPGGAEVAGLGADVKALLCRARVLVTDYSSIAFDASIAGSDVVYFQFDRGDALGGRHTYVSGDFDYQRDGLGPVCTVRAQVIGALTGALSRPAGRQAAVAGHERVMEFADGDACARVVQAIEELLA